MGGIGTTLQDKKTGARVVELIDSGGRRRRKALKLRAAYLGSCPDPLGVIPDRSQSQK